MMGGEEPPMDNQDPMMDDPNMAQDMGGEQPTMDGQDTMMGDPNMAPDMGGEQPPMGDQDPMMGDPNMGGDDSTMSIINQLSDEDREAVRAYAESMLSNQNGEADNTEPMMESVVFTKKQMDMIFESFGPTEDEIQKTNKKDGLDKKKTQNVSKKSPFNSPKFN